MAGTGKGEKIKMCSAQWCCLKRSGTEVPAGTNLCVYAVIERKGLGPGCPGFFPGLSGNTSQGEESDE